MPALDDIAGSVKPAAEPFTGRDETAPHGRTREGSPRAAPKRGATPRRRTVKEDPKDYREQILALFQLPAGALAVAGMQNPIYAADSRAVTIYAPGIADSLNTLALERPEVAAALERVLTVGPYGAVIAATLPLCLQILTNHGRIPPGTAGTVPAEQLIADLIQEAREAEAVAASGNGEVPPENAPNTG